MLRRLVTSRHRQVEPKVCGKWAAGKTIGLLFPQKLVGPLIMLMSNTQITSHFSKRFASYKCKIGYCFRTPPLPSIKKSYQHANYTNIYHDTQHVRRRSLWFAYYRFPTRRSLRRTLISYERQQENCPKRCYCTFLRIYYKVHASIVRACLPIICTWFIIHCIV